MKRRVSDKNSLDAAVNVRVVSVSLLFIPLRHCRERGFVQASAGPVAFSPPSLTSQSPPRTRDPGHTLVDLSPLGPVLIPFHLVSAT